MQYHAMLEGLKELEKLSSRNLRFYLICKILLRGLKNKENTHTLR